MDKPKDLIVREEERVLKIQKSYSQKYPSLFTLGGAFGLVATFYGFEKIIDQFTLFQNNPWILLVLGIALLVITGKFYNKL
jgi:uncharacterized integral membrane protein